MDTPVSGALLQIKESISLLSLNSLNTGTCDSKSGSFLFNLKICQNHKSVMSTETWQEKQNFYI